MITILKQRSLRHGRALTFSACITLSSGCATLASKPPVTVGQVIQMSKDSVPAETIVSKMRDSRSVYPVTAAQLAELHDMGVADRVLDYMQQTYINEQRREQKRGGLWGSHVTARYFLRGSTSTQLLENWPSNLARHPLLQSPMSEPLRPVDCAACYPE